MRSRTELDWDELERIKVEQINDPAFSALSKAHVHGEGDDNPIAFLIGEAPGAQEEMKGKPFVGPAGIALDDCMAIAGLRRYDEYEDGLQSPPTAGTNTWVTNVVKFRPPGNRNPTDDEIAAARPYLQREWIAVGCPRVIIPVGGIALRAITGKRLSILKEAGRGRSIMSKHTRGILHIWPMVHPSFGIRNPPVRPLLERDWEKLGEWLASHAHRL